MSIIGVINYSLAVRGEALPRLPALTQGNVFAYVLTELQQRRCTHGRERDVDLILLLPNGLFWDRTGEALNGISCQIGFASMRPRVFRQFSISLVCAANRQSMPASPPLLMRRIRAKRAAVCAAHHLRILASSQDIACPPRYERTQETRSNTLRDRRDLMAGHRVGRAGTEMRITLSYNARASFSRPRAQVTRASITIRYASSSLSPATS